MVDIPLRKNVQPPAITARQKTSLEIWDKRREEQLGKEGGPWDAVYCVGGTFRPSIHSILPRGVAFCRLCYDAVLQFYLMLNEFH